jgi:hypothetical protein
MFKTDFFSLVIRSCWFVGFFFTPIYMLILTFVVFFGPKKGVLTTFLNVWNFNYQNIIYNLLNTRSLSVSSWIYNHSFKFQYTLLTSRTTVYILFSFWLFFYFIGETYLLIIFNFLNLSDSVSSHFFFVIKNHNIFELSAHSSYLNNILIFFIFFFTTHSIFFLLSLRYSLWYHYIFNTTLLDTLLLGLVLFFFNFWLFFVVLVYFWKK